MKKNLLFGMMAVTMLFATSCEKEADLGANAVEKVETTVTFKVGTPQMATRAYSDGSSANVLQYAVYNEAGELLPALTVTDAEINGSADVQILLATGDKYAVVFWAAADNAPYTVDFENKKMTVNYKGALSNDESRDAFYAYYEFEVTGAQTETVELMRPFAQLNIGTNDFEAAANAGFVPTTSSVTVKNIYAALNFEDGTVSEETPVTFAAYAIPTGENFPVSGYEYLAMNYLLVNEQEVVNVEFSYADGKTRSVDNVPVQRNYRTNLFGQLMTSEVEINVEIKPDFADPSFDQEILNLIPVYYDEAETEAVEGAGMLLGEDIYVVYSANGMKWIADQIEGVSSARSAMRQYEVNGKEVKLLADIDLTESNWDPIGDNRTDVAFTGTFDGQGHTIKGAHITGDHCFNGAVYGNKEGWGLFAVVDGATIKNLKIDGATFGSYTVITGTIAGYANNTTFENIDITNSKVAGYNWYTGGVVGWAAGECTFKNVNLDETVAVGTLWDSHGQSAGGIAGGVSASAKITIEDCNIACVMDVLNDVTSNYKWCVYRVAGMIIGNTNTTETVYNEVVTATATNVTCKNVTVTYGKWMNYHYCEGFWNRGWGRYESSDYVGGVDEDEPHNHVEGEEHCACFPFDQLFGGSSNGSGHYPVKGLAEFPGVTVVYPAEYTCPVCGQQHNVAASAE